VQGTPLAQNTVPVPATREIGATAPKSATRPKAIEQKKVFTLLTIVDSILIAFNKIATYRFGHMYENSR
jgi:hypothetical protein